MPSEETYNQILKWREAWKNPDNAPTESGHWENGVHVPAGRAGRRLYQSGGGYAMIVSVGGRKE